MSADLLRKAAEILRERATAVQSHSSIPSADIWFEADVDLRNAITGTFKGNIKSARDDANWIALMTPGVGLALADWLDAEAAIYEKLERISLEVTPEGYSLSWGESTQSEAEAVARLIVGEQS